MARWFPERASSWPISLNLSRSVRKRWRQKAYEALRPNPCRRKISLKPEIIDFMLSQRFVNKAPVHEPGSAPGTTVAGDAARQPDRGRLSATARRHHQRRAGALREAADRVSAPALRHRRERLARRALPARVRRSR